MGNVELYRHPGGAISYTGRDDIRGMEGQTMIFEHLDPKAVLVITLVMFFGALLCFAYAYALWDEHRDGKRDD